MGLTPGRRVVATAPVRVADVGGWTDTWFGSPGQVCSVAVSPGVTVTAELVDGPSTRFEDALLDAAMAAIEVPGGVEVSIASAVPPGASLGTSAAVVVAMLGALDALAGGTRTPAEVARLAHRVETVDAGREAGVQDQWAAAMGGCSLLQVGPYPDARHRALDVDPAVLDDLADRLVTVVFGAHDSSAVHHEVIHLLTACGGSEHDRARRSMRRLASLTAEAADALVGRDLDGWGALLSVATEEQRALHAGLVGEAHDAGIDVARSHGALGWKVNGAGGAGGSLTVLAATEPGAVERLTEALSSIGQVVALRPSAGLAVEAR